MAVAKEIKLLPLLWFIWMSFITRYFLRSTQVPETSLKYCLAYIIPNFYNLLAHIQFFL